MNRCWNVLLVAWLLAAPLATNGCGYSLATPGADLPRDVRTLYVAPVEGDGADPEIHDALARELRRLVRERAYFRVSESESAADAVLRVHLVDFVARPVAFDKYDEVLDYETTMRVDATLVRSGGTALVRRFRTPSSMRCVRTTPSCWAQSVTRRSRAGFWSVDSC